jgi:TetR/AcrR family transcriptional regulator, tetracycline repressor protein
MKRRGRPPSFSRADLVATARALGPDGIGMKEVAAALGVSRTSLYWHVRDQDELGEVVLAEVIDEASIDGWEPDDGAGWEAWLEAYARTLRRTLLAAGGWLRSTHRRVYSPDTLRTAERVADELLTAGFPELEAAHAIRFVSELTSANVRLATGADEPKEDGRDAELDQVGSVAEDHPNLRRTMVAAERVSHDMQFEYDLACALAGIRCRVDAVT